ncbi:hypothetical protein JCM11491_003611 [Sporobolomyces phaffii]
MILPNDQRASSLDLSDDNDHDDDGDDVRWRRLENARDEVELRRATRVGAIAASVGIGSSAVGMLASAVGILVAQGPTRYKSWFGTVLGLWCGLVLGQGALWWEVEYRQGSHSTKLVERFKFSYLSFAGGALLLAAVLAVAWRGSFDGGHDHTGELVVIVFEVLAYLGGTVVSMAMYCSYAKKVRETRSHSAAIPLDSAAEKLVRRASAVGRSAGTTIKAKAQSVRGSLRSKRSSIESGPRARVADQTASNDAARKFTTTIPAISPEEWETTDSASDSEPRSQSARAVASRYRGRPESARRLSQASMLVSNGQASAPAQLSAGPSPRGHDDPDELFLPSTSSIPKPARNTLPSAKSLRRDDELFFLTSELSPAASSSPIDRTNVPACLLPATAPKASPRAGGMDISQRKYVAYSPPRPARGDPTRANSDRSSTGSPPASRRSNEPRSNSRPCWSRSSSSGSSAGSASDALDQDRGRLTPNRGSLRVANPHPRSSAAATDSTDTD